MKQNSGS